MAQRRLGGHPALRDRKIQKLCQTMEESFLLVREMQGRIDDEDFVHLQASACGLMWVYEKVTRRNNPLMMIRDIPEERLQQQFFSTMTSAVQLVQELEGRLDDQGMRMLKSAAFGMMHVYAVLTGKPKPNVVAQGVYQALIVKELAVAAAV